MNVIEIALPLLMIKSPSGRKLWLNTKCGGPILCACYRILLTCAYIKVLLGGSLGRKKTSYNVV